jgi:hypothetical protein
MKRITARIADLLHSVGEAAHRIVLNTMTGRFMGYQYAVAVCAGYFLRYVVFLRCAEYQEFSEFTGSVMPLAARLMNSAPEFIWTGPYVALLWMLTLPFHLNFPLAILLVSENRRSWGFKKTDEDFTRAIFSLVLGGSVFFAAVYFVPDPIWGDAQTSGGMRNLLTSESAVIWILPLNIYGASLFLAGALSGLVHLFQAVLDLLIARGAKRWLTQLYSHKLPAQRITLIRQAGWFYAVRPEECNLTRCSVSAKPRLAQLALLALSITHTHEENNSPIR